MEKSHQYTSKYFIANFISYNCLSPSSRSLIASLDSISIPKIVKEALKNPGWQDAMSKDIHALDENHTWDSMDLPHEKKVVG